MLITSGELPGKQVRRLVASANEHGFRVKVLPSYEQLLAGRFAVVPREGATPDPDELINLVKTRKGSAHAPKQIRFVKQLPMTGVGKVDKKVLRAGFWSGRDRMVG